MDGWTQFPVASYAQAEGDADERGESLSIKDLKTRLSQHGLQAHGCVEKAELQAGKGSLPRRA